MSERSSYSSHYPYQYIGSTAAPSWELLGHGSATGDRDPLTGEPRTAAGLTPWFNIRFTLGDGSRVDVLAALLGGRAHVEELRAEPPLPPQALAGLSAWIGACLEDAAPAPSAPCGSSGWSGWSGSLAERTDPGGAVGLTVWTLGSCAFPAGGAGQAASPEPEHPEPEPPEPPGRAEGVAREPEPEPQPVRHRARPGGRRGRTARRAAAEAYLAAREQGSDPVLAVMCATGHSRRKSLRIIAAARDEGFLTPRHVRR